MYAHLYTDGACKGNPGPGSIGCVLLDEHGGVLATHGEFIGDTTSNRAEYEALRQGLQLAKDFGVTHLSCKTDSKNLADHFNGKMKIEHPELSRRMKEIKDLINHFEYIALNHVYRESNKEADRIANMAYRQEVDSLGPLDY